MKITYFQTLRNEICISFYITDARLATEIVYISTFHCVNNLFRSLFLMENQNVHDEDIVRYWKPIGID